MSDGQLRPVIWRQGGKVPHHIYRQRGDEPDRRPWPDGDPPVATFLDPADALLAVSSVNDPHSDIPRHVAEAAERIREDVREAIEVVYGELGGMDDTAEDVRSSEQRIAADMCTVLDWLCDNS